MTRRALDPEADEALNRTVKNMEWRSLLRGAFPLIGLCLGIGKLYLMLAERDPSYYVGAALAGTAAVMLLVAYIGRLREIRKSGEPNTRHYPLMFLGAALLLLGIYVPFFLG